jgi:hypothetical protein
MLPVTFLSKDGYGSLAGWMMTTQHLSEPVEVED